MTNDLDFLSHLAAAARTRGGPFDDLENFIATVQSAAAYAEEKHGPFDTIRLIDPNGVLEGTKDGRVVNIPFLWPPLKAHKIYP